MLVLFVVVSYPRFVLPFLFMQNIPCTLLEMTLLTRQPRVMALTPFDALCIRYYSARYRCLIYHLNDKTPVRAFLFNLKTYLTKQIAAINCRVFLPATLCTTLDANKVCSLASLTTFCSRVAYLLHLPRSRTTSHRLYTTGIFRRIEHSAPSAIFRLQLRIKFLPTDEIVFDFSNYK